MSQDQATIPDLSGGPSAHGMTLNSLLRFLEQDPANPSLLLGAAEAAVADHKPQIALDMLSRAEENGALSPGAANLKGLASLQAGDYGTAASVFTGLIAAGHDDPAVRFNLAWATAMLGDPAVALDLLDDAAVAVNAQGPVLKVRMLHRLSRLDEALLAGRALLERYPTNGALAGALSVVAMDNGDMELAAGFAALGRDDADAHCTHGLIALSQQQPEAAMAEFERAIDSGQDQPRAWLGRGLGLLSLGDAKAAVRDLERAANMFGQHIGSWIATGWGYFALGDLAEARRCFAIALELDENFAESHGSIAVVDLAEGRIAEARRGATTAVRLNRQCFSGALAKSMLAEHDGNPSVARKIRERAVNVAIGADGKTIASALVAMGMSSARN